MSFNNSDITDLPHGFLVINLSAVEDLADVELVENFTEFGLDDVVHSEDEAEARRASSYPASSSQVSYTNPMILEQLQNKDERIVALEEQNATILSRMPLSLLNETDEHE
uniref:Uncharacterized protein n=1 Tax=Brassica campestris TaxID=3711 RepID=M4FD16_BRACM